MIIFGQTTIWSKQHLKIDLFDLFSRENLVARTDNRCKTFNAKMNNFTVSFEYKRLDGQHMTFSTTLNRTRFNTLLNNRVFDLSPALSMFKKQCFEDLGEFAEASQRVCVIGSPVKQQVEHQSPACFLSKEAALPKKRGRPPKVSAEPAKSDDEDSEEEEEPRPKKRGRPPKNPTTASHEEKEAEPKKKRGRPPKNPAAAAAAAASQDKQAAVPKKRGRPPKNKEIANTSTNASLTTLRDLLYPEKRDQAESSKKDLVSPAKTPRETPSTTPAKTPSTTPAKTPSKTPAKTPSKTPAKTPPSTTPAKTPSKTPVKTPSTTPAKNLTQMKGFSLSPEL